MNLANTGRILFRAVLIMIIAGAVCHADDTVKRIPVPGHGSLLMKVPAGWGVTTVQTQKDSPPTIVFQPEDGKGFKFLITALWNPKDEKGFGEDNLKKFIEDDKNGVLPQARETCIEVKRIDGKDSKGFYYSATDKAPKQGEFEVLTRAIVKVGNLLLSATLLSRPENTRDMEMAIEVLGSARQDLN